ncbi:hypothetical protein AALP_AAs68745U000600 [Arabis alpina]|uniref:Uncharacterized protein n=1 Tax=Arabis alpina TaxID=50452 RepID=A0A087G2T4_ARAAL|nr:hypothetical protein AALP_AAs68745U000600 [Arabis alpina]
MAKKNKQVKNSEKKKKPVDNPAPVEDLSQVNISVVGTSKSKKRKPVDNPALVGDFFQVKNSVVETSKSKKRKPVKDPTPVEEDPAMQHASHEDDLSQVNNSATPVYTTPNNHVVETSKSKKRKSKKRKHAEDLAPVEYQAMMSSDDEMEIEIENKPKSDSESDVKTGTKTATVKSHDGGSSEKEEEKTVSKPHLYQKVWKDEEELLVLHGMIKFKNDKGKIPTKKDMEGFYCSIEESISNEVRSLRQLSEKISRMKYKYLCIGKSFTSAHDLKCLELAKVIWGPDALVKKSRKSEMSKKKRKKMEEDDKEEVFEKSLLIRALSNLKIETEESLIRRWRMVDVEKRKEIEETLKNLGDEKFNFAMREMRILYKALAEMDNAST